MSPDVNAEKILKQSLFSNWQWTTVQKNDVSKTKIHWLAGKQVKCSILGRRMPKIIPKCYFVIEDYDYISLGPDREGRGIN